MTTTPVGWLTLLAAGIYESVKAYDALTVSVEEQYEKMEESLSAYKESKNELSSLNAEIDKQEQKMKELLKKDKLAELIEKYKELAGSDTGHLFLRQIKSIQFEITELVGAQADNLDLVNGKLDIQIHNI